jgi:hypothetical protein
MANRSVYAVSRGSTGPYEYVQLLKDVGLSKQPDVVVMQIYGGNDLRDSIRYHRWAGATEEERAGIPEERSLLIDVHAYLDNPLGRNSYAYNTLVVAVASGIEIARSQLDPSSRIVFRYQAVFPDGSVELNVENGDRDEVRNARRLRAGESSLELYDQALETFAALAREHGFLPILSYAPSAFSAYAEFVEFLDPGIAELMLWFCDSQREHLRRKSEELGLVFVDLTPALRRAARELQAAELLYRPISVHPSRAGYETVAKTVAEVLASQERYGAKPN